MSDTPVGEVPAIRPEVARQVAASRDYWQRMKDTEREWMRKPGIEAERRGVTQDASPYDWESPTAQAAKRLFGWD